ncbi:MAG TPA: lysophospholipid acyltransferase family protein [Allosphingosinicella sp.]
MRLTFRIAAIVLGFLACLPLHYLWKIAGRRSPWPRRFLGWTAWCAGARVRVTGTPLSSNVLFLANHLSWLDILVVAGASGASFVSKDDVKRWPLIGWLASLHDTIFVARSDRNGVKGQADQLRAALATGQPVALFPEGTTEGGHEILPFRASLLSAVFPPPPNLKVQPIALDYGEAAHDIAWVGKEPAPANARRVLSRRGILPVTVHFLAPIDPHEAADRKALAIRSRDEILAALDASAEAPDRLYAAE